MDVIIEVLSVIGEIVADMLDVFFNGKINRYIEKRKQKEK